MATDGYLFAPAAPAGDRFYRLVILTAVMFVGVLLAMATALGMLKELAFLAVAAIGTIAVWRYPQLAAAFLVAFAPVNRFVIFVGFRFASSPTLLHGEQLWKDAIVGVLLVRVIHETLIRKKAPRLYLLDLLIFMFVTYHLIYLFYPGTVADNSLLGRMLGFRLDAYFLFAYFVGRGLTLKRKHVRWIVLGIIPGSIIVALVAAWQWVFPGWANNLWNTLGYQAFVDATNGSSDIAVRTRDLAGISIPRASSLLMSDLALAFYQLLLIPIAAAMFLVHRKSSNLLQSAFLQWGTIAFLLLMLATLAFSGTRSAMLAVPISLVVLLLITRSFGKTFAIGVALLPLVAAAVLVLGSTSAGDWFQSLFSSTEGSSVAHTDALQRAVNVIQDEPLGRGLGTSHTVGFQTGVRSSFATESWYLQLGTETGIPGLFLYSLAILGAVVTPLLAYPKVRDPWLRTLTLGTGGAAIGFLLVGLVLHVWEAPIIAAVFWLLVGIAVRAPQLEEQWREDDEAEAAAT